MFQRFHDVSQFSNVIKQLLATEPIPLLQTLTEDSLSTAVPGCNYILDGSVVTFDESTNSSAHPTYKHVTNTIAYESFVSNVPWYDGETHKRLGDYLRYLRDTTSVDLMRYYNCYNATEITDLYIQTQEKIPLVCSEDVVCGVPYDDTSPGYVCGHIEIVSNKIPYKFGHAPQYRVIAVPIKFNTEYKIAIESEDPVLIGAVIYDSRTGLIPRDNNDGYYSDESVLANNYKFSASSRFNNLLTYSVNLNSCSDQLVRQELYSRQDNLYMLIQVSSRTMSSVVVLEGKGSWDYTSLSLLRYNTGVSYAFSDRLVEYLLGNVICSIDPIVQNTSRIQRSVEGLSTHVTGIWNTDLQDQVLQLVEKNSDLMYGAWDHDGNVNKDVEYLLSVLGVYRT